jgi:hypothetical protein
MWRAIKVTIDPTQTVAYQGFGQTFAACAIAATSAETPDFRLDLENAGKFAMSNGAYELQFDALTSCIGKPQNCTLYDLNDNCSCAAGNDGISHCTATTAAFQYGSLVNSPFDGDGWTRSGSTLAIKNVTEFEYCVNGDTMTLHDSTWGLGFTMERVQAGGTPLACASRDQKGCGASNDCHPLCSGGATCSAAADESSCTNRQGCTWDTARCAGVAKMRCELQDFDIVPGCSFLSTTAKCTGIAAACGGKTQIGCGRTPGCRWGPGCFGDSVLTCSDNYAGCGYCNDNPGCTCDTSGDCLGAATFSCSDMKTSGDCIAWGPDFETCSWAEAYCNGKPTPCDQLSVTDCAAMAGCAVEAM